MTALNKQALREAATEATQGGWYVDYDFDVCHESGAFIAETHGDNLVQNAKFIAAANPATVLALLDELEAAANELSECKNLLEKIKSTSCHVDTSKDAFIPNSLDAWGRPVPQYLPYDFSGNPGASATQYCNGWNDAGGYWLNHVKYLQECIRAAGIGVKGE